MRGLQFVLKIFLLCAASVYWASAWGQSTVDLALKNLHRQKWQRSHELLTKALAKDSLNVTAKYVLAQYFFSERNPAYHLDSAYRHILGAQLDFQNATAKQHDRLKRFPVDSLLLVDLRRKIDSVAFHRAGEQQSEAAWIDFIEHFPSSYSLSEAISLRDSLAYENARQENTHESFQSFLQRYPDAKETSRARVQYEQLLFEDRTRDQTLASFENFLSNHPLSPHRRKVEETIFEYLTASGHPEKFIEYVRAHPESPFVPRAKNILFHLIPESDRSQKWPADFLNDSLTAVINVEDGYLVPFLTKKKFGFINHKGDEIISTDADSLSHTYLCGNIHDDFLILPDKVIGKNSACIWGGAATNVDDIGLGFLIIEEKDCRFVLHKTGFRIGPDCIDNAKLVNGQFIAMEKNERWSVFTLTGRLLVGDVEDIYNIRNILALKTLNKVTLITSSELATLPLPPDYRGSREYEDARSWNNDLVFVRNGTHTGLLDQSLRSFVAPADQILSPIFSGVVVADSSGYRIHNYNRSTSNLFQEVIARDPWIAVRDSSWRFLDPNTLLPYALDKFDTIIFQGPFAIAERQDSSILFFSPDRRVKSQRPLTTEFLPGKDSVAFLLVDQAGKKVIYDQFGKKILTTIFDKIQYAGAGLFIVQKKDKRGLMSSRGNLLLPPEYDAIAPLSNGIFSLLKSGKFGLFDSAKKRQIPPTYGKNLSIYSHNVVTAFKAGAYGFIGWNNSPLSKFEFNEIQFWNDTAALVKKNYQWMLYEIKSKRVLVDRIKDMTFIENTAAEKLAIVHQDVHYGILHNQRGTIIPLSFSDIVNVGSTDIPLYFTEKKVEEAPVFIVMYYNDEGKLLRTEVYDEDDYDKIYCQN